VYKPTGCYLSLKLDAKVIEALKIDLTIEKVKESILKTRKIKLKPEHIKKGNNP